MVSALSGQVEAAIGTMTADGRTDDEVNALRQWSSKFGDERVTTEVEVGDDGEANWSTLLAEFDKIALHG